MRTAFASWLLSSRRPSCARPAGWRSPSRPTRRRGAWTSPSAASRSRRTSGRSSVKKPVLDPMRSASGTHRHARLAARSAAGRARRSSASRRPLVQLRERQRPRLLEQLRRDQAGRSVEDGHDRPSRDRVGAGRRRARRADDRERLGDAGRQGAAARAHAVRLPRRRDDADDRSHRDADRRSTSAWSSPTTRKACSACASRGSSSSRRTSRRSSPTSPAARPTVPEMDNTGVTGEYLSSEGQEGRRRLGHARPLDDAHRH